MHEVKAYVHRNRIGEVIAALKASSPWALAGGSGPPNLAVYIVKGSLLPVSANERQFSIELGDEMVNEYKLELLCEDENVDELVDIISKAGRTGQTTAGWVYVTAVLTARPIVGSRS